MAVELAPDEVPHWYAYGEILRNLKEWNTAAEVYGKTLELDPKHTRARLKLGFVLFEMGSLAQAEAVLFEATRVVPKNAYAHLYLGRTYAKNGRVELGAKSLKRFLELAAPNYPEIAEVEGELRALEAKLEPGAGGPP